MTKRPTGKLKILAQLADNIFHTTKAYRVLTSTPKPKWQKFADVERDKIAAWERWRSMKQAALLKDAGQDMPAPADVGAGAGNDASSK